MSESAASVVFLRHQESHWLCLCVNRQVALGSASTSPDGTLAVGLWTRGIYALHVHFGSCATELSANLCLLQAKAPQR